MATFEFDAYTPEQIADKVETIGVRKARLPTLGLALLGALAGAEIGLGALFSTLVTADEAYFAKAKDLGAIQRLGDFPT